MQSFTIDASVVLKWISREHEFNLEQAKQIFINAVQKKYTLITPSLLKAEISNILLKKKKLSVPQIKKGLSIIKKANLIYTELHDSLIDKSVLLAQEYNLSVYDGIYLATAELSKTLLISDDEKGHGKINNVILLKNFK